VFGEHEPLHITRTFAKHTAVITKITRIGKNGSNVSCAKSGYILNVMLKKCVPDFVCLSCDCESH